VTDYEVVRQQIETPGCSGQHPASADVCPGCIERRDALAALRAERDEALRLLVAAMSWVRMCPVDAIDRRANEELQRRAAAVLAKHRGALDGASI